MKWIYQERDDDTYNKQHVHNKRVARSWQTRGMRKKGKQVHSFLMTQNVVQGDSELFK